MSKPDHTADPDARLMLAFASGKEEAFVELYQRYRNRIINYARRLLGDLAIAEEAAQDIFIKLYQSGKRYQPKSRFSTFIYRIATNHCLNIIERHDTKYTDRNLIAEDLAQNPPLQVESLQNKELSTVLIQTLTKLPARQRVALVLCHYQGLNYQEIAKAIKVSQSAVKSLIHRARETMLKELQPFLDAKTKEVTNVM